MRFPGTMTHLRLAATHWLQTNSAEAGDWVATPRPRTRRPRRERNVHVDPTKVDTAVYDSGRTTVMTGGVMLGRCAQHTKFE